MSDGIHVRAGDMDGIEKLLSAGDKRASIMARYMATEIPRAFELWLQSEIDRKKDIPDLLQVVASLQAQVYACLAVSVLSEGGDEIATEAFLATAKEIIPEHIARMRAMGGRA